MNLQSPPCPLCCQSTTEFFFSGHEREYFRCKNCDLIFVETKYFLNPNEEKERYDLHENDIHDPGYREFLNRLAKPVMSHLKPQSSGLDFGSGPGPLLSLMLKEGGHEVGTYDPYYDPNEQTLEHQYDFITASEVLEHLHDPRGELIRLWNMLKPSGLLGVMTSLVTNEVEFSKWHYARDPTHVVFYSRETMKWLAREFEADLEIHGESVILLFKS